MLYHLMCVCLLVITFAPTLCAQSKDSDQPTKLSRTEIHKLLLEEYQLIGDLSKSLSDEQRTKADPKPAFYRDGSPPDQGGLALTDLAQAQKDMLIRACEIRARLGDLSDPIVQESCRFFQWSDPLTHAPQGYMGYRTSAASRGLLLGAQELDEQQGDSIHAAAGKVVGTLYESLDEAQRKKVSLESASEDVWQGGLPYSELSLRQRQLFLDAMDLDLSCSGEGRTHLSGPTEKWRMVREKSTNKLWLMLWCIGHGFDIEAK
jgi:hypothetical protein